MLTTQGNAALWAACPITETGVTVGYAPSDIQRAEDSSKRFFNAIQPVVNTVEPAADLRTELCVIALDMGDRSLDGSQPHALLALFVTNFTKLAANST